MVSSMWLLVIFTVREGGISFVDCREWLFVKLDVGIIVLIAIAHRVLSTYVLRS